MPYYCSIVTLCALAAARKESFPTGLYSQGLIYGGPVVLVWGWVCAGGLHTLAAFSMSELSSAFPVSGGLYYWSFMLGGNHGPFVSWMVGWINLLGQVCYIMSPRLFACLQACCTINTASARMPLPMHSTPGKTMLLLLLLWHGLLMVRNNHCALSAYLLLTVNHDQPSPHVRIQFCHLCTITQSLVIAWIILHNL